MLSDLASFVEVTVYISRWHVEIGARFRCALFEADDGKGRIVSSHPNHSPLVNTSKQPFDSAYFAPQLKRKPFPFPFHRSGEQQLFHIAHSWKCININTRVCWASFLLSVWYPRLGTSFTVFCTHKKHYFLELRHDCYAHRRVLTCAIFLHFLGIY